MLVVWLRAAQTLVWLSDHHLSQVLSYKNRWMDVHKKIVQALMLLREENLISLMILCFFLEHLHEVDMCDL